MNLNLSGCGGQRPVKQGKGITRSYMVLELRLEKISAIDGFRLFLKDGVLRLPFGFHFGKETGDGAVGLQTQGTSVKWTAFVRPMTLLVMSEHVFASGSMQRASSKFWAVLDGFEMNQNWKQAKLVHISVDFEAIKPVVNKQPLGLLVVLAVVPG